MRENTNSRKRTLTILLAGLRVLSCESNNFVLHRILWSGFCCKGCFPSLMEIANRGIFDDSFLAGATRTVGSAAGGFTNHKFRFDHGLVGFLADLARAGWPILVPLMKRLRFAAQSLFAHPCGRDSS